MKSFKDIEAGLTEIKWFDNIKDVADPKKPICINWLSYSGWMTYKLEKEYPNHTLKVTSESMGNKPQMLHDLSIDSLGFTREIVISILENISIFAQTYVPNSTMDNNSWIMDLGEQPLGSMLSKIEGLERSDISFANLNVSGQEVLCRRSSFQIGSSFIYLVEAFLPNLNKA